METRPDPTPARPPARRRLAFTFGALPAGVVLCEVVVRVLGLAPVPPPEVDGGVFRPSPDPTLLYVPAPGAVKRVVYRDAADAEPRVVEHRINGQGFRGPEVSREKPPGVLRLACVGDSHTFGEGVHEDETWPALLGRELAERVPEVEVEVLNFGVGGYDTAQEARWIETHVMAFDPDAVLLQYFLNDTASRDLAVEARPDGIMALTHPRRDGLVRALRNGWRSLDLALDVVYRRRALAVYGETRGERYDEDDPGWVRVREELARISAAFEERDIPFGVVLYPYLVGGEGTLASDEPYELVNAFCLEQKIDCVDMSRFYVDRDLAALRVSPHDFHANADANRIFAEQMGTRLSNYLRDELALR